MNRLFQFKTMWFLAGMLLIIGCQREDEMPFEEPPTVKRMIVTAADIPDVTQTLLQKMGMGQDAKLFSANSGGEVNELAIDWEHIKQLIDTTGRETYAFGIQDTDPDPRVFYNLVLRYSENKEAHQPFIIRYKMDEDFLEEYLQTQSLEHFRGTTQKIPVKGVAGNPERSRAYLDGAGDGILLDEPCPRENPVDGGGGGPDPGSGGGQTYECSSYIVTTTWYSQACSSDGCEPPVQIGEEQSIVTECGWVYENEAAGTNDDCDPETGEIPIVTVADPCKTTKEDLKKVFPNTSDAKLQKMVDAINKYVEDFDIDTKEELQHFLAQAGHESAGFTSFSEYQNYRVKKLSSVWSSKFNPYANPTKDSTKQNPKDYEVAGSVYADVQKLMNFVYADENRAKGFKMGNTSEGDGYKYRGRGIFQLTGKYSYNEFTIFYQANYDSTKNFVTNPGLLETDQEVAVISALWFYKNKVLNSIEIDSTTSVNTISEKINGGENGAAERKELFTKAVANITCK